MLFGLTAMSILITLNAASVGVGVFVGGKSQALLGSGIAKWLSERQ